jgi:hypothetical protein
LGHKGGDENNFLDIISNPTNNNNFLINIQGGKWMLLVPFVMEISSYA